MTRSFITLGTAARRSVTESRWVGREARTSDLSSEAAFLGFWLATMALTIATPERGFEGAAERLRTRRMLEALMPPIATVGRFG